MGDFGLRLVVRVARRSAGSIRRDADEAHLTRLSGSLGAERGWVMSCWRR